MDDVPTVRPSFEDIISYNYRKKKEINVRKLLQEALKEEFSCKCQYKNVQKWQNKNVQLFKTNMIF